MQKQVKLGGLPPSLHASSIKSASVSRPASMTSQSARINTQSGSALSASSLSNARPQDPAAAASARPAAPPVAAVTAPTGQTDNQQDISDRRSQRCPLHGQGVDGRIDRTCTLSRTVCRLCVTPSLNDSVDSRTLRSYRIQFMAFDGLDMLLIWLQQAIEVNYPTALLAYIRAISVIQDDGLLTLRLPIERQRYRPLIELVASLIHHPHTALSSAATALASTLSEGRIQQMAAPTVTTHRSVKMKRPSAGKLQWQANVSTAHQQQQRVC